MDGWLRRWLTLGLLAILVLVGACGATQRGSAPEGDPAQGRRLWAQSDCGGCHGPNAEGARGGPALVDTPLTLREVTSIVRRGGPGMPKYATSQIGNEDLQHVYAWFQTPVAAATEPVGQDPWAELGCAACHGADGLGGSGPSLAGTSQPYAAFAAVVRRGAQGMPAYSAAQASDEALQAIHAWLQAPAPTATEAVGQDPWTTLGCAACHGVDGLGGSGPSLAGTSQAFTTFEAVVRQGAQGMPAYSAAQASDEALQAIHAWLRSQSQVPEAQQAVWTQAGCGACHGANAEGGSAPRLTSERFSYDEFQRVVRRGEEGMPAYNISQISDVDLQRMYEWLIALP
jgi:mono/diheme cytochrome c family protein